MTAGRRVSCARDRIHWATVSGVGYDSERLRRRAGGRERGERAARRPSKRATRARGAPRSALSREVEKSQRSDGTSWKWDMLSAQHAEALAPRGSGEEP
jgi:hypothetical protein